MYWKIAPYAAVLVFGVLTGWVINGWRLEARISSLKAIYAQELADSYAKSKKKEAEMSAAAQKIQEKKDAQIRSIDARLGHALNRLRDRPDRMPDTATDCKGTTGASVSRPDAEFLTREAARADRLRSALEACYEQYDSMLK